MSDWQELKWGDLATLEYGKGLRDYRDGVGDYPVFGTNGQIGWHTEPLCTHPGVIVGRKGAYRGIEYSEKPFYVIDTAFYLSPRECHDFDMRWAYYELLTHDINRMNSGSAIPSTSRDAFYQLPLLLPPLEEQHAIADVLGSLDDKIELNRRMNRTLESLAQAIFRSWFVDFDPILARADGRKPYGMTDEVAALFPDRFVDSELGPIPEGWRVATIGNAFKRHRNSVKPSEHPDESFKYYSIPNYDSDREPTVEVGSQIGSSKHEVTDGSILVSKLNPHIPRVWLPEPEGPLRRICSTEFLVCEPIEPLDVAFAYCLFLDPTFRRELASLVTGTSKSHQRVRTSDFERIQFVAAPASVLDAFKRTTSSMLEKTLQGRFESQVLASLRDTLLPKLLSGEIRVSKAEEQTAADV